MMSTRKRNDYLDITDSDEDLSEAYESAQEESRGALTRPSIKRRKIDTSDQDDSDASEGEEVPKTPRPRSKPSVAALDRDLETPANNDHFYTPATHLRPTSDLPIDTESPLATVPAAKEKLVKPLSASQLARSQSAAKRTGVIYLSRIPPFMKPSTLRTLLVPTAPSGLGRIFLTPEDATTYQRRRRAGGNRKKSFADGWVEYVSKKEAKIAVELLNGNLVGGKKGGYYHDDVWNMRYLKGFKWKDLTEQIANEDAERASRLRAEIARTRKENREFVADVERAKVQEGMREKRASRRKDEGGDIGSGGAGLDRSNARKAEFRQNRTVRKRSKEATGQAEDQEATKRVVSKIF